MTLHLTKTAAVIIDLDGTLCNNNHRKHHIEKKPKDWKSFSDGCSRDTPHAWCQHLVYALDKTIAVIYVSGRSEEYRFDTEAWLGRERLTQKHLFMRKEGDNRPDTLIKEEIYHQHIKPFYDILFCIDDRPSVCRMWRSLGLICLQCNDVEF